MTKIYFMKRKITIIVLILILVSTTGLVLYGMWHTDRANKQLRVAATFFPLADMVRQVAGDTITVVQILPTGSSPHTFDPTPGDIKKIEGSQLIFKNGLSIDDWIDGLSQSAAADAHVVSLGSHLPLLCDESSSIVINPDDSAEEEDACNPHTWLSIPNAKQMIDTITQELSTTFPQYRNDFQENATTYKNKLSVLDNEIQQILSGKKNRNIITFHDAFRYFARDYNINIVATIEPFPGKQPTPKYIQGVVKTIQDLGVQAVFREPQLSDDVVTAIATDAKIDIGVLDPEGSSEYTNYIDMMRGNAKAIADSLE